MLSSCLKIDSPEGIQVVFSSWIAVFTAPNVTGVGKRYSDSAVVPALVLLAWRSPVNSSLTSQSADQISVGTIMHPHLGVWR
jgi:hypothetical protein